MNPINTGWADFKSFIQSRNLSAQYLSTNSTYYLTAIDGLLSLSCQIIQDGNADQIDFETNFKLNSNKPLNQSSPFSSKMVGTKKLFRRKHGVFAVCQPAGALTDLSLTIPYTACKVNKIEIVGCAVGDYVNLKVYDTLTGTMQQLMGVPAANITPNLLLNQFGFGVRTPDGYYEDHSEYDADLYMGMLIEVEYINNGTIAKTIGVNYTLHELR